MFSEKLQEREVNKDAQTATLPAAFVKHLSSSSLSRARTGDGVTGRQVKWSYHRKGQKACSQDKRAPGD